MQLSKGVSWRAVRQNWLLIAALILLLIFPFLVGALTNTDPTARRGLAVYWQGIAIELLIYGILTMSYNLLFGFTGVISFGHALFFGLAGYLMGGFQRAPELAGSGLAIGIVVALSVCAALGLLIGTATLRLKGVYFAIFTLAIAEMAYIFLSRYEPTGSEDGFTLGALPEWFDPTRNRIVFYYIVAAIFIFTFILIRRLMESPTGAVLLAIRENENRARTIGFNTLTYKLLAIVLAGVLAGMAGILFTLLNKKVGPEMLGTAYTVNPLLMTIIGGAGTLLGPVIGAVGLRLLELQLRNVQIALGDAVLDIGRALPIILGALFILVVLVFPYGIVGTFTRWRLNRRARSAERAAKQAEALKSVS
ncbi:MAG: hypothetical protein CUN49_01435 [Candidatus Thermofonsia Clade 1 bacterium]|jgi:branched-chain amino acid transport system permease protein|uniref:Branched-chain amino acid ABC transporter permease n=1 Tax=Candidatus Thermofonsia Clade 1 bacterium TaxID=2364210 RepID=A0A2M8PI15_9CHLR|nr:MAG: hypothetical protein CUN49_01435 [Candidatus Thermofonsia Clade 1 bacterium]RMF49970.1 MAG: branched-chain amino acid ABC transporter permease [Chloroflexota bacterium]